MRRRFDLQVRTIVAGSAGCTVKPFDDYPGVGCTILKPMSRTNTRRGNGLWLMGNAGQDRCAYCGVSFVDDYYFGC